MINYSAVQTILNTQLKTVVGLPTYTEENVKAVPDSTVPWCRSTLLPAETQIIGIGTGGQRKDQGLYQIDIYWPQNSGSLDANTMGDLIQNSFVRGTYYINGTVKVLIDSVYRLPAGPLTGTVFYHIPLMVRWSYYDQG